MGYMTHTDMRDVYSVRRARQLRFSYPHPILADNDVDGDDDDDDDDDDGAGVVC